MRKMRVIVAGGREFDDRLLLWGTLDKMFLSLLNHVTIISGNARGADKLGEEWAKAHGLTIENGGLEVYPADWDKLGKAAGYRRNVDMSRVATHAVLFWDGVSKGTKHMLDISLDASLWLKVVRYLPTGT